MGESLPDLWAAQQKAPFPQGAMRLSIGETPLLKLDAATAAILTGCLRIDGVPRPLPPERRRDLEGDRDLLRRALAELALDPASRAYFERLEAIASAVLRG